jgi:hypothetical protein
MFDGGVLQLGPGHLERLVFDDVRAKLNPTTP